VVTIPITTSAFGAQGEDYRRGPDDALFTLVVFSDFQCPACQRVGEMLQEISQKYRDRVRLVFKNYPLDNACNTSVQRPMHTFACQSAIAARCAGRYGLFWELHDLIFAQQSALSGDNLKVWSKKVGLTDEQITACATDKGLLEKVQEDIALGNKLAVNATPTVFLNGERVTDFEHLEEKIRP
jgi:protein-disulfide isomerase